MVALLSIGNERAKVQAYWIDYINRSGCAYILYKYSDQVTPLQVAYEGDQIVLDTLQPVS